jgi:ATP-dependent helicase HrpB
VEEAVAEVRRALAGDGAAVLVAPPGAGKTTVVPLRLLGEPWLGDQRIVVLEPRRIAARAAAERMASLLGERVGQTVGYRTRDERAVSRSTRIEVVTEGILVRRLQQDPSLEGTGAVLLDEVHERNLVTDLSLALLADVRASLRPDLRVMAMSATLDAGPVAALLGGDGAPAAIVRSEGRTHPVEVRHVVPGPRDRLDALVARAVGGVVAEVPEGDVLAFVPGVADVRRVVDRLRAPGALPPTIDVRPLSGSHDRADQDLALAPSPPGRRRVVVATDIAESSLTVAGVRAVVDAGLVRVPRLDASTGTTRLQTEPASLASADQRAGRAGRLGPGLAVRAWDPAEQGRRPASVVPEITVVDLAPLALELAVWGAPAAELAFLTPPAPARMRAALDLLGALGAVDASGRPTATGRAMADLPVHPRLAALVLGAVASGHGWTGALLAGLLEEGDVLRGDPAHRPVDLALRLEAIEGGTAPGVELDRRLARLVERRAVELARRCSIARSTVDVEAIGGLVAMAYPERIAQGTGGGAFRLRDGGGGRVPAGDALAGSAWLAVAQVVARASGSMVALAAPLTAGEVATLVASDVQDEAADAWDESTGDLRATRTRRSGALVLRAVDGEVPAGEQTVALLLDHVRRTGVSALGWTPALLALQGRLELAHRVDAQRWPAADDATLLATVDEWLAPLLHRATSVAALRRVDLRAALLGRVDPAVVHELDRLTPSSFAAADGRAIAIAYDGGEPRARVRPQRLFGLTAHPTVGGRHRLPVVLELLSPADRPIQVTADLPGFWAGSWSAVRKDLAGRYPKHPWPTDPAAAEPPVGRGPRR